MIFTGTLAGATGWVCEAVLTDDSWGLRMIQRSAGNVYRYDEDTDSFVGAGFISGLTAQIIAAAGLTSWSVLSTRTFGPDLGKTDISARLVEVL